MVKCSVVGCEERKPTVWLLIDRDRETYSRCDAKGRDPYGADVHQSGIFTIYELRGGATFLKMSDVFRRFIDVATSGVSAFVNSGTCEPQKRVPNPCCPPKVREVGRDILVVPKLLVRRRDRWRHCGSCHRYQRTMFQAMPHLIMQPSMACR